MVGCVNETYVLAAKPNVGQRFAQRKDRQSKSGQKLNKQSGPLEEFNHSGPLEEISNLTADCQLGTPLGPPTWKI